MNFLKLFSRKLIFLIALIALFSCDKTFTHQRFVKNNSNDTITVVNPDFDSLYYIMPGNEKLIYSFKSLDRDQESEPCRWLGDTLIIKTIHDTVCTKSPLIEAHWTSSITPVKDGKIQKCTFSVENSDF